ncbi:RidA family protein [Marimonas arenosa]|uniref:RidA family protein n=1 Tax=Marimonas arenosa TaxID=1795305 RepID=A0AAE3WC78_9RHOB|nr:RidA family protein [Marimonas arenosa]MDQ2089020.1 RidA family protein [Marimonas arenosa]
MSHRLNINPPSLWPSRGYPMHHAVVEPEGRRVHLTGQVAWDAQGRVIGADDAEAQTHAALDNIERILAALGGTLDDVVSLTTFFTHDGDRQAISRARQARLKPDFGPAATGVRVAGLWSPDLLVELTAIAVIPPERFKTP